MTEMVKLANGKEVTLDEFLTWSGYKQNANLNPAYRIAKRSDETRAKMSAAHKGSKKPWVDNSHRIGAKHTDEARAIMSYNATNKSEEHRAKISAANKGRKNTWAHKICKPVMTPNGLYPSLTAVKEASGVSSLTTIYRWMKKWPEHYYYVN